MENQQNQTGGKEMTEEEVSAFGREVDEAYTEIVGFIEVKKYRVAPALIALCRVYSATAAFMEMNPEDFLRLTMGEFAKLTGGEIICINANEEPPKQSETIQ